MRWASPMHFLSVSFLALLSTIVNAQSVPAMDSSVPPAIASTLTLPPYPAMSLRMGEQGTTTLKVVIGSNGGVMQASIEKSSGSDRLDQAALEHVKATWKWQPPTSGAQVTTLVNVVWDAAAEMKRRGVK
jgi:TonB family protein